MFSELARTVAAGQELGPEGMPGLVDALGDAAQPVAERADFLIAWAIRGETPTEVAALAGELRNRSVAVPLRESFRQSHEILDVCGTGGDRLNTFNISTTVALICAAAGVPVAKHGNRAITSKSGSADVLEALGIPVDLSPEAAARAIEEAHFAFLFAPRFHPAFKGIAPVRALCAERGQRTVFNRLGPLLNPARPSAQLLGVSRIDWVEPMAKTLQALGLRRAMVVSGEVPGHGTLDELSTLGTNHIAEFYQDRGFSASTGSPADFPLAPAALKDLEGGNADDNAAIIVRLLEGADCGPRRDAVLLNASAALFVAARVRSMGEGWELAEQLLRDRRVLKTLDQLRHSR
ncbi:MAG: anthranilate phosphoribosyltransferase [Verrucomicrobiota bacterium]